jgi:serine/threonine protein kinase
MPAHPHPAAHAIGPFAVDRKMFTSGMSEAFLVYDPSRPDMRLVLKRNLTGDNRLAWEELLRNEVEYLVRLRHPSVVRICPFHLRGVGAKGRVFLARETETDTSPWFFVMEYIGGGSLESAAATIKTFPLGWRLELFYQIIIAIDYMHRMKLAHCDLKPGNILFRMAPNAAYMPRPVLIDFGSVSPADRLRRPSGTVRYASPEMLQAINRPDIPTDHIVPWKNDIWALGALLFEIVTGRPLINEQDRSRATTSTMRGEFDDLQKIDPTVPKVLARLVNFMTSKEMTDRPPTSKIIEILEQQVLAPPFISAAF